MSRQNRRIDRGRHAGRGKLTRRVIKLGVLLGLVGLTAFHGARLADARGWLALFQIREVRVVGVQVTNPNVLVAEAGLMGEVLHYWSPLGPYAQRVARDPLIRSARIRRRFPNRLTLEVTERQPVAFLALERLTPVDSAGVILPVSAFHAGWDAPVVRLDGAARVVTRAGRIGPGPVSELLGWLQAVERDLPALAREISSIELGRNGTITLRLVHAEGTVLVSSDTPVAKLAMIDDVLRDLREKALSYRQLDLRFRDQIVVRRG
ncbi:MAG: cell division protein FtsQ/DivIB [Gemmatimonadota bacterium]